jgi:hypothetical protein
VPRAYKLILFYAFVILLAFDVHAVVQRFLLESVEPIAWLKVTCAFIIQALTVGGGATYLGFLGDRRRSASTVLGPFDSWRIKLVPIIGIGVVAAFSIAMLYNGMVCGSQPLPTVHGVAMCTR